MKIKASDFIYDGKMVEDIQDAQELYTAMVFMNTKYINLVESDYIGDDVIRLLNTNEVWNIYSILDKYKHERIVIEFINDVLNPLYNKINSNITELYKQLYQFCDVLQNYNLNLSFDHLSSDAAVIYGLIGRLDNSHPFSSFARLCNDFILRLLKYDLFKEDLLQYYISLKNMIKRLFESISIEVEI